MTAILLSAWLLVVPTTSGSSPEVKPMSALSGVATWYNAPSSTDAAAGPALRVGDWRGSWVTVQANGRAVEVQLTDWCACPNGRLIDLDDVAFGRLAPLSRGIVRVTIDRPTPPATDTR